MRTQLRLGKFFGIEVKLDITVLILLFLISSAMFNYLLKYSAGTVATMGVAILTGVLLIGSILAHEFGHALTGQKFGIPFGSIILHMLGGVAGMTGRIPYAKAEFWMALAGPLTSYALCIVFAVLGAGSALLAGDNLVTGMLGILSVGNFVLGTFNMLPAFPLDGGRVLRSIIWWKTDSFINATAIASKVGKGFAVAGGCAALAMMAGVYVPFFGVGFGDGLWLGIIAALVYFMAHQENKMAKSMYLR